MRGMILGIAILGLIFLPLGRLLADDSSAPDTDAAIVNHAKLLHKLRTIIIPKFVINKATYREALQILTKESIKADPEHRGIGLASHFNPDDVYPRITLSLENVSVKEILSHLLAYGVGDSVVSVWHDSGEGLSSRTFVLPRGCFLLGPSKPGDAQQREYDLRDQLAKRGVRFPPGTSAIYTPERRELKIVNSWQEVNLVDEILNP